MTGSFAGVTFDPAHDEARLNEQTVRVYRAMLDEQWRTLQEIASITHDPLQSISARLRDLRKPDFGSFDIQRRRRGLASSGLWEYRMQPPALAVASAVKARRTGFLAGLIHAAKIVAKNHDLACVRAEIKAELIKASKKGKA